MQSLAQPCRFSRPETLERLGSERFDVLVIGGGIVGAGTAALAARHGLSVALVERADFGSGASSASSKLVHGGLRYLRMGDVRLVREALREARVLRRVVAPHLVRELPFVLPVYRDGPYGRAAVGAGLALYAALTGSVRSRGRLVPAARAEALAPLLRLDGLRGAGLYDDAQTDDARLCLENVTAAAEAGAVVANRVEAVGIERGRVVLRDLHDGGSFEAAARTVVNAAGASVDAVRRLEDPRAGTSVALSKGVHLVLERPGDWGAALTIPVDRTRVSFAVPWQGMLLLGTTDTPFEPGEPPEPTAADEAQILAEAGRALPPEALRPDAVLSRFAGLRVLPLNGKVTFRHKEGSTAPVRREVTISRGRLGVVSVAGGKLTTYRTIARAALGRLRVELGLHRLDAAPFPLPGAGPPPPLDLEPELALHLTRAYGSQAADVLAHSRGRGDALEPLAPGALDVVAQALWARDREWALEADDVLRRRTTLALRGLDSPGVRELFAGRAAAR